MSSGMPHALARSVSSSGSWIRCARQAGGREGRSGSQGQGSQLALAFGQLPVSTCMACQLCRHHLNSPSWPAAALRPASYPGLVPLSPACHAPAAACCPRPIVPRNRQPPTHTILCARASALQCQPARPAPPAVPASKARELLNYRAGGPGRARPPAHQRPRDDLLPPDEDVERVGVGGVVLAGHGVEGPDGQRVAVQEVELCGGRGRSRGWAGGRWCGCVRATGACERCQSKGQRDRACVQFPQPPLGRTHARASGPNGATKRHGAYNCPRPCWRKPLGGRP